LLEGLTRDQYLALAKDIYGSWTRGDIEPLMAFFHDKAIFRLLGSRAMIPAAGFRIGKQEIREAFRALHVDFEIVDFEIDDLAYNPPYSSFMSWRLLLRNRGTQVAAILEGVDHLSWSNAKIVKLTSYFDTALLAALASHDDDHSAP